ncbi:MAG: DUF3179 domain-containing (seleno)protein [Vicinamibacterales bacterium]
MSGKVTAALVIVGVAMGGGAAIAQDESPQDPPWQTFITAAGPDRRLAGAALADIASRWRNGFASMLVDLARLLPPARRPRFGDEVSAIRPSRGDDDGADPSSDRPRADIPAVPASRPGADIRRRLIDFLARQTGQRFDDDLRAWRRWMWSLPAAPHPEYAAFKAEVYGRLDPAFRRFFKDATHARIRLDEIDWGGVGVNGIPPLRRPKHVSPSEASWLRDNHIVFGIEVNGEARAYPKRILAWHEMATDSLGGVDVTVVYCTLCGTVIPYESSVGGRRFTFGTSGLLYRSNKLMFDEETSSLWSALEGVPVVGPLAASDLRLPFHSVVTTTWAEWKRDHPSTTVVSIETGYERDYAEGAAYREYFATDRIMFEVPVSDTRLKNKAEVLAVRTGGPDPSTPPLAIAVERLRREPVFNIDIGGYRLVVVTSPGGTNRVFQRNAETFSGTSHDIRDAGGRRWTVTRDALVSEDGARLAAVPTHRAFWFGWVAQFPDTMLVR